MKSPFIIFFSSLLIMFIACHQYDVDVHNLSVNQFEKQMRALLNHCIIDVRTPEEYQEGHIHNAININVDNADFETQIQKLNKNKSFLVYCRSGRRSNNAIQKMIKLGFYKVYNLDGGIIAWQNEKKAISKISTPLNK